MVHNLTKENFFDDLRTKCPLAVEDFCKWIDNYKVLVGWDKIFQCNAGTGQVLKLHELPLELQTGVIGRYIVERMALVPENGVMKYEDSAGTEHREHLARMFKIIETDFEKKKNSLN